MSPRHHRVRVRPKLRTQRRGSYGLGAAFLAVALSAAFALWLKPWRLLAGLGSAERPWTDFERVLSVEVSGLPDSAAEAVLKGIDWKRGDAWGPLRASQEARSMLKAHSFLKTVKAKRSWFKRSVIFEASLREPVAVLAGVDRRMLDSSGEVFDAFAVGNEEFPVPEIDARGLPPGTDLKPLARLIAAAQSPDALPSALMGVRFVSEESGWEAFLADGTYLEWGRLEWNALKLGRLREVLADAAPRFPGALTADLKHFEDGKILVRPR